MYRRQGGAHTRRCTHKAEYTTGGLWPPQEYCYFRGVHRAKRAVAGGWLVLHRASRYTHKAVHPQGGAHKRRSVATARVLLFKGRAGAGSCIERSEPQQGVGWCSICKAVHTQGGAHKKRSVATARVLLFKQGARVGPRMERSEP